MWTVSLEVLSSLRRPEFKTVLTTEVLRLCIWPHHLGTQPTLELSCVSELLLFLVAPMVSLWITIALCLQAAKLTHFSAAEVDSPHYTGVVYPHLYRRREEQ
mmetsp:Transcript_67620/g.116174  ORF Transcript_67620/g.116174 Transcript_67620/m.116174 type:complete len:102 (-) Transcript_67620:422-727(-)